jgi:hypothetical protein
VSREDEIRARLEAATPGPWEASPAPDYPDPGIGFAWDVMRGREVVAGAPMVGTDADLIANAPADLAYLLGEVERMRAALYKISQETPDLSACVAVADEALFGLVRASHAIPPAAEGGST